MLDAVKLLDPLTREPGQWGLRPGVDWLLGELAHQARDLHHAPVADELAVGNPEHLGPSTIGGLSRRAE